MVKHLPLFLETHGWTDTEVNEGVNLATIQGMKNFHIHFLKKCNRSEEWIRKEIEIGIDQGFEEDDILEILTLENHKDYVDFTPYQLKDKFYPYFIDPMNLSAGVPELKEKLGHRTPKYLMELLKDVSKNTTEIVNMLGVFIEFFDKMNIRKATLIIYSFLKRYGLPGERGLSKTQALYQFRVISSYRIYGNYFRLYVNAFVRMCKSDYTKIIHELEFRLETIQNMDLDLDEGFIYAILCTIYALKGFPRDDYKQLASVKLSNRKNLHLVPHLEESTIEKLEFWLDTMFEYAMFEIGNSQKALNELRSRWEIDKS